MTPIPLYTWQTAKLDGQKLTENLSACCIRVNFRSGTYLEYDLQGHPLRPSEVERLVQNLLPICLNSRLRSFEKLLDENLAPSSVTISAVRLHRSLSSVVSEDPLSSVYLTSLTIDSDDANQDNGGKTIRSED